MRVLGTDGVDCGGRTLGSNEVDSTRADPANFDLKNPSGDWRRSTAVHGSGTTSSRRGTEAALVRATPRWCDLRSQDGSAPENHDGLAAKNGRHVRTMLRKALRDAVFRRSAHRDPPPPGFGCGHVVDLRVRARAGRPGGGRAGSEPRVMRGSWTAR